MTSALIIPPTDISQIPDVDFSILLGFRGSVAHGCFVPSHDPDSIDDVDYMSIVVPPEQYYFGLEEYGSRGTKEYKEGTLDVVVYEARKFIGLLCAGNPNVLCMLWLDPKYLLKCTPGGAELIRHREMFLSKKIFESLVGYARGQLHRMTNYNEEAQVQMDAYEYEIRLRGIHSDSLGEMFSSVDVTPSTETLAAAHKLRGLSNTELVSRYAGHRGKFGRGYMGRKRRELVKRYGYDTKNAAHLIRLLRMGEELFKHGQFFVLRPDRDELLAIKRGAWTLTQVQAEADRLFAECEAAMIACHLPDAVDLEAASEVCRQVIANEMRIRH